VPSWLTEFLGLVHEVSQHETEAANTTSSDIGKLFVIHALSTLLIKLKDKAT